MASSDTSSSVLEEAVRQARYNETIHVEIDGDSLCLVPTITDTGDIEFQRWTESVLARELQTNRWFFPMLNDSKRNQLYDACIQKHVNDKKVLEIGTGTGLLSLLSEKHGAKRIESLEMSAPQSEIARSIIPESSIIQIRNEHSTETNLDCRYEVLISELLEDGLLGEGWLSAMRDAWNRHLTPNATVIPASASTFGQLVYVSGFDSSSQDVICLGTGNSADFLDKNGQILPIHSSHMLKTGQLKTSSNVFSIFDFDVSSPDTIPKNDRSKTIVVDSFCARANAVMVWWNLGLDETLTYEIDPHKLDQDHWHPCLHFIPELSTPQANATVTLLASHDDTRIRIQPIPNGQSEPPTKRAKAVLQEAQVVSIGRTLQLCDGKRLATLHDIIRDLCGPKDLVLDVSDYPIAGCICAKLGAKRVVSLESSSGCIPAQAAQLALLANELTNLDVYQCYPENLNLQTLGGHIDLVVAEPYFQVLEGWHLHEAIRLAGIIKTLRSMHLLSSDTRFLPMNCRVRGCLISSSSLRSAYSPCGDERERIQGFDHSFVNGLGWSPQFPILSLPLWQYEITELSAHFDLGYICYDVPDSSITQTTTKPEIIVPGRCDGLKVWVEYALSEQVTFSTNDNYHNQLLQMTNQSFEVSHDSKVLCVSSIGPMTNGNECQKFQIKLELD